jgi:hypothetical protein
MLENIPILAPTDESLPGPGTEPIEPYETPSLTRRGDVVELTEFEGPLSGDAPEGDDFPASAAP